MKKNTNSPPPVRDEPPPPLSHIESQRRRWQTLLTELEHPDVELCVETAAPIVATYSALKRAGEVFDRSVDVLMVKLREQLKEATDDDRGCFENTDDEPDFRPPPRRTPATIRRFNSMVLAQIGGVA